MDTSLWAFGEHKPPTVKEPLDLAATATPCKLRLVDCEAMRSKEFRIRILEFAELPTVSYAAISYPWRGVQTGITRRSFHVQGAEGDADPVGGVLLRQICSAALERDCPYLWLDRLCIMQNKTDAGKEDRRWQIRHMYQVYKSCKVCIILPGGLQRVAFIDEPTTWIHRSWTLQETLAPPEAVVVFRWRLGPGNARVPMDDRIGMGSFPITESLHTNGAVMLSLRLLLVASAVGTMIFTPNTPGKEEVLVRVSIFSAHLPPPWYDSSKNVQPRILATNVCALSMAMEPEVIADSERRGHAVWQSALMRTSSRPVDMVFSIMGLFDVQLDPGAFHKDDRRGATIELAREILKAGGRATWLGLACRVPPDRSLSTFPTFPRTTVSGKALVDLGKDQIQEVSELMEPVYPVAEKLLPLPKGAMDANGCLMVFMKSTHARQMHVTAPLPDNILPALDGSFWKLDNEGDGRSTAFVALLGWFHWYYPGLAISEDDTRNIRLVLLESSPGQGEQVGNEDQAPLACRVRSFIYIHQSQKETVLQWPEKSFRIGAADVELEQNVYEEMSPWPVDSSGNVFVTECMRRAKEAHPYESVEKLALPNNAMDGSNSPLRYEGRFLE